MNCVVNLEVITNSEYEKIVKEFHLFRKHDLMIWVCAIIIFGLTAL